MTLEVQPFLPDACCSWQDADMSEQRRGIGWALFQHGVAFTWGFAEATVFFVVPDAWTSAVGLRRPARAQALTRV